MFFYYYLFKSESLIIPKYLKCSTLFITSSLTKLSGQPQQLS